MNRRDWLKLSSIIGSGIWGATQMFGKTHFPGEPVLRIAHLTDIHLQPGNESEAGFRRCLEHVLAHSKGQLDFVLSGGDLIMDALRQDASVIDAQWDLWAAVVKDYPQLRWYHCLGNHDVDGSKDPSTAKEQAMGLLGMDSPYYTFSQGGWHFIVLDSTHVRQDGKWYTALLDTTQYDWLVSQLDAIPVNEPILILSHIPILGATPFLDGDNAKTGDWIVPGAWMHLDAKKLINLFYRHKNVKLCLSGHIHLYEQLIYNDTTYYCNGAVSGNWWQREMYEQTPNGYGYLELFGDGSHRHQYVTFDW